MGVFVDRGYRTLLGLPFYDRVRELEFLSELLGAARTVVVYGPRNVGKSELARYYAQRRSPGSPFLLVDARRRSAEGLGLARPGVLRELLGLADKLLSGALRVPSLVGLAEGVSRVYRSLGPGPIIVVVDEFHLLYTSRREALLELERVAGYLAKRGEPGARLVVTSSEGFVTLGSARRRLLGYSAGYLPVEGLDKGHMEALYSDYRARYSCGLGFKVYWGVFGGSPGYLVEACSLGEERLFRDYLPGVLRDVVDEAIASISAELSKPPSKVLEQASRILGGPGEGSKGLGDPRLDRIAERLVEYNVLYPCRMAGEEAYLPQLPIYAPAIRLAAEKKLDRTSRIPPDTLKELAERNEWSRSRCMGALQIV